MKSLSKFEAFKLDKNQMNAIAGGKVICYIHSGNESIPVTNVAPGITPTEAGKILADTYRWADSVTCTENGL